MIDPSKITSFEQTDEELQEQVFFWIFAIQNNANTASRILDAFLTEIRGYELGPFEAVKQRFSSPEEIAPMLKEMGLGKSTRKSEFVWSAVHSTVDFRRASPNELQKCIKGFGPKTASCFVLHTRRGQQYAGLDTHVLAWLRLQGVDAPKDTPQNPKLYEELQEIFLKKAKELDMSPAELDLKIWNLMRN